MLDVDPAHFQAYKTAAVLGAAAVAAAVQARFPLDQRRRAVLENWRVNLPLAALNALVMALVCGGCASAAARWAAGHGVGLLHRLAPGTAGQVLVAVLALDLAAYAWHVANHKIPFLWRFHAVHHSDRIYDASTAVRFHAGELLISLAVRLAVVVALGLPVAGILAFELVYAFFNFFEHGNIALPAALSRRLGRLVVTPALHRVHHAAAAATLDSNFGTIFSFWDRLFRTFNGQRHAGVFAVGLPDDTAAARGLRPLLAMPLTPRGRSPAGRT